MLNTIILVKYVGIYIFWYSSEYNFDLTTYNRLNIIVFGSVKIFSFDIV